MKIEYTTFSEAGTRSSHTGSHKLSQPRPHRLGGEINIDTNNSNASNPQLRA